MIKPQWLELPMSRTHFPGLKPVRVNEVQLCSYISEDSNTQFRLFSQAPERYFWNFACFNGTVNRYNSCSSGYIDLVTRDTRPGFTGEIDLNGFPWDLVLEDLKFTGIGIADPEMKYLWRGPGIMKNVLYEVLVKPCILMRG